MTDWWDEIESEMLECLQRTGVTTPYELGRRLGIPEAATASLLSILVREGKVRMCLVQRADDEAEAHEAGDARARPGAA